MKRKTKLVVFFAAVAVIAVMILIFNAVKMENERRETKRIESFHHNQDKIVGIKIRLGNGRHGEIKDPELIADIIASFDRIQVREENHKDDRDGWSFSIYCYDENGDEIFTLRDAHPWFIRGESGRRVL